MQTFVFLAEGYFPNGPFLSCSCHCHLVDYGIMPLTCRFQTLVKLINFSQCFLVGGGFRIDGPSYWCECNKNHEYFKASRYVMRYPHIKNT